MHMKLWPFSGKNAPTYSNTSPRMKGIHYHV